MALTEQLRSQVESTVNACYELAESKLGRTFVRPALSYRRAGKNAGSAFLQQNRINLNPVLLAHNTEAYLLDVIPHEISHLLVHTLYGRVKPHGPEWQSIMMEVFGRKPLTTHQLDLTPLGLKTVDYQCRCRVIPLSIRRHNNIVRNKRQYLCRTCGEPLRRLNVID